MADIDSVIQRAMAKQPPHIQSNVLGSLTSGLNDWLSYIDDMQEAISKENEVRQQLNQEDITDAEKRKIQDQLEDIRRLKGNLQKSNANLRMLASEVESLRSRINSMLN